MNHPEAYPPRSGVEELLIERQRLQRALAYIEGEIRSSTLPSWDEYKQLHPQLCDDELTDPYQLICTEYWTVSRNFDRNRGTE